MAPRCRRPFRRQQRSTGLRAAGSPAGKRCGGHLAAEGRHDGADHAQLLPPSAGVREVEARHRAASRHRGRRHDAGRGPDHGHRGGDLSGAGPEHQGDAEAGGVAADLRARRHGHRAVTQGRPRRRRHRRIDPGLARCRVLEALALAREKGAAGALRHDRRRRRRPGRVACGASPGRAGHGRQRHCADAIPALGCDLTEIERGGPGSLDDQQAGRCRGARHGDARVRHGSRLATQMHP
mmetsp:Transcript_12781/g.37998  ORF Transcript_12781/g.37998 Transcript_12781/m.37998 type:complete len:238 (+) Transcript_12781:121-834(+)